MHACGTTMTPPSEVCIAHVSAKMTQGALVMQCMFKVASTFYAGAFFSKLGLVAS